MKKTILVSAFLAVMLIGGVYFLKVKDKKVNDINLLKNIEISRLNKLNENNTNEVENSLSKVENTKVENILNIKENIFSLKKYIANIGVPNIERKKKINSSERYGDIGFEVALHNFLDEDSSDKKINNFINISYEFAYQTEVILNDFANDKLSYIQYMEAMNESHDYIMEKNRKILNEDEFQRMYSEESEKFNIEEMKKNQMFNFFPNIDKDKYNIDSVDDFGNYFTEEELEKISKVAFEKFRKETKSVIRSENDKSYSDELVNKNSDEIEKSYISSLKNFLSEEQLEILNVSKSNMVHNQDTLDYEDEEDDAVSNELLDGLTEEQKQKLENGETIKID